MAIKTFSTGEVLTASDTNTFLANAGLVYVTSTTATSGTIAIDNCFTSTYDSYRVIILQTNVTSTGTTLFRFRAGGVAVASADYYYGGNVHYYNTTTGTWNSAGATTSFVTMIASGAVQTQCIIDLSFPRSSQRKQFVAASTCNFSNYIGTTTHGIVNLTANTYDGMQITQDAAGTITATVQVFGVRKA